MLRALNHGSLSPQADIQWSKLIRHEDGLVLRSAQGRHTYRSECVTKEKIDYFRNEAAHARSLADTAMTEEIRRGYLQLARDTYQ